MEKKCIHWFWNRIILVGFLLSLCCILPTVSHAQISFEKNYGGSNTDEAYSVQQTSDGGYILAGYTFSFGMNGEVYLVKTDSLGNVLWTKTYGSTGFDLGFSVREISGGGYIIAGSIDILGPGSQVYLIRTDPAGDTLWTKTYGGVSYDEGYSGMETSDGGFIIAGGTTSFGAGSYDVYLIKTDSSGNVLWTKTYGGSNNEGGLSVQETIDSGYVLIGRTSTFGAGDFDIYLIKTNSGGDTLWTKTFGGADWDQGYSVEETQDGGYILVGFTESFGSGNRDVYLVKTDSLGLLLWSQTYGDTARDEGHSVRQTSDGGYVIAGLTYSFGSGTSSLYLIKTDSLGNPLWTRTYGGASRGKSVQLASDGGFVISGATFTMGSDDFYLVKTDASGLVGIEENTNPKSSIPNFHLFQNEPNPFRQWTIIRYSVPETSPVTLKIYDLSGRLAETLVDEKQEPGVYQVQWTPDSRTHGLIHSRTPSGIYFYRLTVGAIHELPLHDESSLYKGRKSGDFTATKKLILLQ